MKIIKLVLVLILALVCLCGCSGFEGYGASVGTVIDKKYKSESEYITYKTQYVENTSIKIPEYNHSPARWYLRIQKEENEKIKTKWIEVTETEYNNIKIGEYYGE